MTHDSVNLTHPLSINLTHPLSIGKDLRKLVELIYQTSMERQGYASTDRPRWTYGIGPTGDPRREVHQIRDATGQMWYLSRNDPITSRDDP